MGMFQSSEGSQQPLSPDYCRLSSTRAYPKCCQGRQTQHCTPTIYMAYNRTICNDFEPFLYSTCGVTSHKQCSRLTRDVVNALQRDSNWTSLRCSLSSTTLILPILHSHSTSRKCRNLSHIVSIVSLKFCIGMSTAWKLKLMSYRSGLNNST